MTKGTPGIGCRVSPEICRAGGLKRTCHKESCGHNRGCGYSKTNSIYTTKILKTSRNILASPCSWLSLSSGCALVAVSELDTVKMHTCTRCKNLQKFAKSSPLWWDKSRNTKRTNLHVTTHTCFFAHIYIYTYIYNYIYSIYILYACMLLCYLCVCVCVCVGLCV